MKSLSKWKKLGETRDDAAGEAFDKVARLLGLPYPGGPEIEKRARRGNPDKIQFPRPMIREKNYDFSFSGLKTSVLYFLRDRPGATDKTHLVDDVAASFQQATIDVLVEKTMRAAREFGARSILLSGGVAANAFLRGRLGAAARARGAHFLVSHALYNMDNAAMIGAAGYFASLRKKRFPLAARGDLNL